MLRQAIILVGATALLVFVGCSRRDAPDSGVPPPPTGAASRSAQPELPRRSAREVVHRLAWVCARLDRLSDPPLKHDEERIREELAELKALTVDCQRAMHHWFLQGEPLS
ncbi:MAG: hypothetical protein JNJ88_09620, partial [Planctomycetes bacterium]|nr:hypothetical protein [Planctomycetota bacterium]